MRQHLNWLDKMNWLEEGVQKGPRDVLMLGYGSVGRATARYLKNREVGGDEASMYMSIPKKVRVQVYDPSPEARARARRDGMITHTTLEKALSSSRVVVSATGTIAIDRSNVDRLRENTLFINAGSADSELSPEVRGLALSREESVKWVGQQLQRVRHDHYDAKRLLGDATDPSHTTHVLRTPAGKSIIVPNAGGVVNFSGAADPIPARYIQLTRGLLYLGALQAAKTKEPGIHALELAPQKELVDLVELDLRGRGESLKRPSFHVSH